MSLQESLYHGVPLLFLPLFADQMANARRAERHGYGRTIKPKGQHLLITLHGAVLSGGKINDNFRAARR